MRKQILQTIACYGPYAITCWYSDKTVVVSNGVVMLSLTNNKIPFCENDFWIWVSYMAHYAVILG